MKLNGIEDTQSLIEEKARDANGKYFYPTTKSYPKSTRNPTQTFTNCKDVSDSVKMKHKFSFVGTRNLFFNCIWTESICSSSIFIAQRRSHEWRFQTIGKTYSREFLIVKDTLTAVKFRCWDALKMYHILFNQTYLTSIFLWCFMVPLTVHVLFTGPVNRLFLLDRVDHVFPFFNIVSIFLTSSNLSHHSIFRNDLDIVKKYIVW